MRGLLFEFIEQATRRAHDVVAGVDVHNFAGNAFGGRRQQERPTAANLFVCYVPAQRRHLLIEDFKAVRAHRTCCQCSQWSRA